MSALRFRVTGNVQGVGFRAHARLAAEELGLVGEVWNATDGSVEGWVSGANVDHYQQRLQEGPGTVDRVETQAFEPPPAERFEVLASRPSSSRLV